MCGTGAVGAQDCSSRMACGQQFCDVVHSMHCLCLSLTLSAAGVALGASAAVELSGRTPPHQQSTFNRNNNVVPMFAVAFHAAGKMPTTFITSRRSRGRVRMHQRTAWRTLRRSLMAPGTWPSRALRAWCLRLHLRSQTAWRAAAPAACLRRTTTTLAIAHCACGFSPCMSGECSYRGC